MVILDKVQEVIARLELMDKQGESYDDVLRHGWRNPIGSDTGTLLRSHILARNPARVLEIGTAYGLSGCYIASAMKGHLDTIEFFEPVAKEAQANFDEAGLDVKVHCGDATDVINAIGKTSAARYSAVFLDAEKKTYGAHLKLLMDLKLLMPDCLILADNVKGSILKGVFVDRTAEVADFLELMKSYPHVVLDTQCGLLVGRV